MEKISLRNVSGYFTINTQFYNINCTCDNYSMDLNQGLNVLYGDIDTGGNAISYTLSMAKYAKKNIVLFPESQIIVYEVISDFNTIGDDCCFIDEGYPLFYKKRSVRKNIEIALKKSKLNCSSKDVKDIFEISNERYNYSLNRIGNERLRCLAAIGYAYNKQIYCFPWTSEKMIRYYGKNMTSLLDILLIENKMILLPTNHQFIENL